MKRLLAFATLGVASVFSLPVAAAEGPHVLELPLLPGEKWRGGRVVDGTQMPFSAEHPIERTLHARVRAGANQAQPLLLSNKGRYVWNEEPFDFAVRDGKY